MTDVNLAAVIAERDAARAALRPQSYRHREDQQWIGRQVSSAAQGALRTMRKAEDAADGYRRRMLLAEGENKLLKSENERLRNAIAQVKVEEWSIHEPTATCRVPADWWTLVNVEPDRRVDTPNTQRMACVAATPRQQRRGENGESQ